MKKILFLMMAVWLGTTAMSQRIYFVYIQTENGQAFYVKKGGVIHSSSASGYVIIPRLIDSTYNLTIGFPQNKWPEQNFSVSISKKDHGFLLKNFGDKGWGLFDLQTLTVQMAGNGTASTGTIENGTPVAVSAFTGILSKASDDPSLMEYGRKKNPGPANSFSSGVTDTAITIAEKKKNSRSGA